MMHESAEALGVMDATNYTVTTSIRERLYLPGGLANTFSQRPDSGMASIPRLAV